MSETKRLTHHSPGGVCEYCKHFNYEMDESGYYYACTAFPEGIPAEIASARFDHRNSYPGDKEIQFELKEGESLPKGIDQLYIRIKELSNLAPAEAARKAQELENPNFRFSR